MPGTITTSRPGNGGLGLFIHNGLSFVMMAMYLAGTSDQVCLDSLPTTMDFTSTKLIMNKCVDIRGRRYASRSTERGSGKQQAEDALPVKYESIEVFVVHKE